MNKYIVSLNLIKYYVMLCYVMLMVDLILLIIIEDVMCCLYELCFELGKLELCKL
jgi:hypothetical protein